MVALRLGKLLFVALELRRQAGLFRARVALGILESLERLLAPLNIRFCRLYPLGVGLLSAFRVVESLA